VRFASSRSSRANEPPRIRPSSPNSGLNGLSWLPNASSNTFSTTVSVRNGMVLDCGSFGWTRFRRQMYCIPSICKTSNG